jgi:hypothetical protein
VKKRKMKSKQEFEKEQDLKTKRQEDKTYAELLYEAQDASKKVAKVYVVQLAEAKRREDYPNIDLENSAVEKIIKMQENIKAEIINDCTWWSPDNIRHYWPEWLKDQYYVDLAKAQNEKQKLKIVEKISAKEQESALEGKREFNLVGSVMHDIKLPKLQPEPEEEEGSEATLVPEEEHLATGKEFGPTPQEGYENGLRGLEKAWIAFTGEEHLIPSASDDLTQHHIVPTRKVRIKIVKGLDEQRRLHLRNCATYLIGVLEDIVKIDTDTARTEARS